MDHTFETVDQKVAETEFFLRKMCEAGSDFFCFNCYLSAFLSASRTVTFALQQFKHLPGFKAWYEPHRNRLRADKLAAFFLQMRNEHAQGGPYPVSGAAFHRGEARYYFPTSKEAASDVRRDDVVRTCREYFVLLLEIIYDAYVGLGTYIDPQQYFTKEHFASIDRVIDDAEVEVHGWVCESLIEEGFDEDDRWSELRGHVGECQINHLFYSYLGKPTPQPEEPEHFRDFEYTPEEKGWVHVSGGVHDDGEVLASAPGSAALRELTADWRLAARCSTPVWAVGLCRTLATVTLALAASPQIGIRGDTLPAWPSQRDVELARLADLARLQARDRVGREGGTQIRFLHTPLTGRREQHTPARWPRALHPFAEEANLAGTAPHHGRRQVDALERQVASGECALAQAVDLGDDVLTVDGLDRPVRGAGCLRPADEHPLGDVFGQARDHFLASPSTGWSSPEATDPGALRVSHASTRTTSPERLPDRPASPSSQERRRRYSDPPPLASAPSSGRSSVRPR